MVGALHRQAQRGHARGQGLARLSGNKLRPVQTTGTVAELAFAAAIACSTTTMRLPTLKPAPACIGGYPIMSFDIGYDTRIGVNDLDYQVPFPLTSRLEGACLGLMVHKHG
jgi:hypothetical protein